MSKLATVLSAMALLVSYAGLTARAQTAPAASSQSAEGPVPAPPAAHIVRPDSSLWAERTFYLNNADDAARANEIVTAIRNLVPPETRAFLLPSQNAIAIRASAEDFTLIQKLINDLDRPRKMYRLTYTLTEMDGGKRIGAQKFAMVLAAGQKTSLKQSSKIPVQVGSGSNPQYTYVDGGISFDATLDTLGNGASLRSFVDQNAPVIPDKDAAIQQPVIRHLTLDGASVLAPGKPMMLGSLDIPGSTRRMEIEVVMEPLS